MEKNEAHFIKNLSKTTRYLIMIDLSWDFCLITKINVAHPKSDDKYLLCRLIPTTCKNKM